MSTSPGTITTEEGNRLYRQLTTVLKALEEIEQLERNDVKLVSDDEPQKKNHKQPLQPKLARTRGVTGSRMTWIEDDKTLDQNAKIRPLVSMQQTQLIFVDVTNNLKVE
jgi:hypothetical protein